MFSFYSCQKCKKAAWLETFESSVANNPYFGFFTRCLRTAFFVFAPHLSPQKLTTSCTTVVGKSDREMLGFSVTLLLHPPPFPPYCEGSLLGTFLKVSKAYGHLKDQLWTWGQIIHTQFHQELLRNIQSLGTI